MDQLAPLLRGFRAPPLLGGLDKFEIVGFRSNSPLAAARPAKDQFRRQRTVRRPHRNGASWSAADTAVLRSGMAAVSSRPYRTRRSAIGEKWTVMVVAVLAKGPTRFDAIQRAIDGIFHKMLTLTLRGLEQDGLVERRAFPTIERQAGLGSVEGLDLALLIERQDNRVGGRRDIKADDVAELVDELRIIGKLELPNAVGLEAIGAPDPVNRTGADARFAGHQ